MSQLSPPIQAVLELFQPGRPLAELRFGDVDAALLSNLAGVVEAAAAAVTEQEAQLAELRQTLADRQDALLLLAQRALAYARVYAEQDEALTEELSRISLPRASKPRKVSAKAAGSEPSVAGSEPSAARSEPSTEESALAERVATLGAEDVADSSTGEAAFEAASVEAPAARKGKRRSNVTRDEAQSSPAHSEVTG